jgi:predicted dinucleotide-binding enzyme
MHEFGPTGVFSGRTEWRKGMKIAIIGKGNVGSALGDGLKAAKHEIRFASSDVHEPVKDAVAWSDVVILAVPWTAHKEIAAKDGKTFAKKIVVDVSNVMTKDLELAMGFTTSGAEELQKLLPGARIVKALNTIFAQNMRTGKLYGERLTAFIAGDDSRAKDVVCGLVKDIGFDCIDAGELKSARLLEPMGLLNITLGYGLKMGTDIGLTLVRKQGIAERNAA